MLPNGPELIIVLIIAIVLFGPSQLPKLGKSLGQTMRSIREGMDGQPDEKPAPKPAAVTAEAEDAEEE